LKHQIIGMHDAPLHGHWLARLTGYWHWFRSFEVELSIFQRLDADT